MCKQTEYKDFVSTVIVIYYNFGTSTSQEAGWLDVLKV